MLGFIENSLGIVWRSKMVQQNVFGGFFNIVYLGAAFFFGRGVIN